MYFSDDIVEEVRSRNDIVDVISSCVKLQKKGSSYFGLCPFHNEKSPSFSVSPQKQMFYCFGCGEGGNVFSFLMKYDSLTFSEALKTLADRAGIELPEYTASPEEKKKSDIKNQIYEINKEAARYYHYLLGTDKGAKAREYFAGRRLKDSTVTGFGLGVSDMRMDALYRYFKQKGFSDEILKQTGLFVYDERGVHDRFRNRVMFPIININNKVIGFGGRVMGDGQPKYLNSPETPVFDKGRNLYGLNFAKNSRKNSLIICEGYMDVISMHQAGFNNAVASLGTALTPGQAVLMKRITKDILICYDSDGPGVKAALRAIGIFREAGMRCKVINMQPYKDADEFIKSEGAESFAKRIEDAENSFLFEIRMLEKNFDINDPDGKTAFLNEAAGKLTAFEEEIERNNYIEAVAARYFVPVESLKKLVGRMAVSGMNRKPANEHTEVRRNTEKDTGIKKAQRMLLTWICDEPDIYFAVKSYISAEDFTEPIYKKVAELLFNQIEEKSFHPETILNAFPDEEEHSTVAGILNTNILDENAGRNDRERAINDAVKIILEESCLRANKQASSLEELQRVMKKQAELKNLHISLN
ncbi:MAG: DNA primase [Butyrivibrio sp.]